MDIKLDNIENNRILIVDDNESIHEDIKKIINGSLPPAKEDEKSETQVNPENNFKIEFQIEDAYQGDEAVLMVQKAENKNRQYALIFMDVRMPPGINGIETIERIWKINLFIEVVICTAISDYMWEEIIKKTGSASRLLFVRKPFNPLEIRQVAFSLVMKRNLNDKVRSMIKNMEYEMEERTKQLSNVTSELKKNTSEKSNKKNNNPDLPERDSLTGLFNLFSFQLRIQELFEASRRHSFPLCVLIFDIDNFKELNDLYGHETGDEILLKISEILKGSPYVPGQSYDEKENIGDIRKNDIAGRYGGDEFAVIMPFCSEEAAKMAASRLLQRIQAISLPSAPEAVIMGNCGIAVLDADSQCRNSKQIISLADKALYYAKSQGKNRFHIIKCE